MTSPGWLETASRNSPWDQLEVLVAGARVAGFAAADALLRLGASVTVVDDSADDRTRERAAILEVLGADVRLGEGASQSVGQASDLVVTSPGWAPTATLLRAALAADIPVWGDVELAWRLRAAENPAPWLCLTGTNGKTTTVRMLESILLASGARATAAGNVGLPLVDAVLASDEAAAPYDVLAVELSSFHLHWIHTVRPFASAVLNVAEDHVDWHGSMAAYTADKGRIFRDTQAACVYNVDDPVTEDLVRAADVEEGCRAVGFTLGAPAVGMLGIVDDLLVDRAFIAERATSAAELASVADVRPAGSHNVANALAAAALARAYGVSAGSVKAGLRSFEPDGHRIEQVAVIDGVAYVDDSKATNPHAAAASLRAFDSVVWLAGGLAKGASFDGLIPQVADRLRAVIAYGTDGPLVAAAVRRHAPDVPVVEVATVETGLVGVEAMSAVLKAARSKAQRGDTVLLAPACASMDQFRDYAERGSVFSELARGRSVG